MTTHAVSSDNTRFKFSACEASLSYEKLPGIRCRIHDLFFFLRWEHVYEGKARFNLIHLQVSTEYTSMPRSVFYIHAQETSLNPLCHMARATKRFYRINRALFTLTATCHFVAFSVP
ncbi:hypothetical protein AB4K20DRAFT_1865505 [Rhizopus microsporus]|uniref:Uncharacterized protein n=1 Tax=Rhizopus microsporus TaxID=58291 RepID=A0A1X0SE23_RHIZD|nr:hypothetical protein BCV71DRAFT_231361 [Rhizopus microsporus]